jgi:hypothetical protein
VKKRWVAGLLPMLGLVGASVCWAEPPARVLLEVNFLLDDVEASRCDFYRNGTWHGSQAAQAHLRSKYQALAGRDLIDTTEQFIEKAASKSSLSGQAYLVRCKGGPAMTSNQWLRDELANFRARK